jgi:hypothetical protein
VVTNVQQKPFLPDWSWQHLLLGATTETIQSNKSFDPDKDYLLDTIFNTLRR